MSTSNEYPSKFGKYDLLAPIGTGGMAEVFKARTAGPDGFEKHLVIKRILPEYAHDRAFIEMLIAEAKVTSLLHHPNIVQIYELGQVEGQHYIAMEYVQGTDLLNLLSHCTREKLRVPTEIAIYIVAEVCKGLAHAHAATDADDRPLNIIHRDVSPSNILISNDGAVKIMDFGVATADIDRIDSHRLGDLKGKLGYMCPEQADGKAVDRRGDIFSLGIVLFECLTLKRLFVGKTQVQTLMNVRDAKINAKFQRHSYIPEPIRKILRTALAKNPNRRYSTATHLQEALLDYLFEGRLRVSSQDVAAFLDSVLAPAPEKKVRRHRRRSTAQQSAIKTDDDTVDEHHAIPALPKSQFVRPAHLHRLDLTAAVFHLKNDDEPTFGPIDFGRLNALLLQRAIAPNEWLSVNGSDWLRLADLPSVVDLYPALFEPEPDRPLLDGPINRVRLPSLFYRIYRGRLDGKLKLSRGTILTEVAFQGGKPVNITSNIKSDLLGPFLIKRGLATEQVIASVLQGVNRVTHVGTALTQAGILTPESLATALENQFRARLYNTFTWNHGWYEFFGGSIPTPVGGVPNAPAVGTILEGIRFAYDLPTLEDLFAEFLEHDFRIAPLRPSFSEVLQGPEQFAFERLSGATTLKDALDDESVGPIQRLHLLRLAFALHQTEHLSLRRAAS